MNFLLKIILSTLVVFALSKVLPGVSVTDWKAAAWFTLIFGFMNVTVKPILKILTLPITCLTLGLFLVFINILVVKAADHFVDGFYIHGWWNALVFSVSISIAISAIEFLLKGEQN